MAEIKNLDLDVKKGSKVTTLIVTYEVCFTACETKAGFYFNDYAQIWGKDPGADDYLASMGSNSCYKAPKGCIKRKFTKRVNNSVLDEDKGFWIFGKRDEIYAKACVKPVTPSQDCATSTIHHDFF